MCVPYHKSSKSSFSCCHADACGNGYAWSRILATLGIRRAKCRPVNHVILRFQLSSGPAIVNSTGLIYRPFPRLAGTGRRVSHSYRHLQEDARKDTLRSRAMEIGSPQDLWGCPQKAEYSLTTFEDGYTGPLALVGGECQRGHRGQQAAASCQE